MLGDMFKRLRGSGGDTAASLRGALAKAEAAVPKAEQTLAKAQAERAALLLGGTDEEVLAAEGRIDAARIALDRLHAAAGELGPRIAAAEIREADEALTRQIDAAEAQATAALARWRQGYEDAAEQIEKLLGEFVAARRAVEQANAAAMRAGRETLLPTLDGRLYGVSAVGTVRGDVSMTSLPRYGRFKGLGIAREAADIAGW